MDAVPDPFINAILKQGAMACFQLVCVVLIVDYLLSLRLKAYSTRVVLLYYYSNEEQTITALKLIQNPSPQ